jgi:hypothetical protein
MDRIRTLLLARTHVVVMDPDLVAQASTRPVRDVDVEKLEDDLAQLGFVLSLDLANTLRRLPYQALLEMRGWIHDTLVNSLRARRPQVPLVAQRDTDTRYRKRMLAWLATRAEQPCPWCGDTKLVGALDPCGHLVCKTCWDSASYTGCPICHRRVAFDETAPKDPAKVTGHAGQLTLVHLGLDPIGMAKQRFQRLLVRPTPLMPDDRDEIEAVIDEIGPKAVTWLPQRIAMKETMAIAIARLWLVSPDRSVLVKQTADHVRTATDVLRVACVLMGGNAALVEPMKLTSIPRGMRRAVLEALERMDLESVVEEMMRHCRCWKRVGERLHPFEHADKLPNAAFAFAVVRRAKLPALSFGEALRERALRMPSVYVEDDVIKPIAWAGPIEDALRVGNPRSALARLTHRPGELLRRADHLVRSAQTRQLDALQTMLKAIELAAAKGPAGNLLTLASHVSRRGRQWPRRVFLPGGDVLRAWGASDRRIPLRGDAIAVMVGALRRQLLLRAEPNRQFPRAVIDRALVDLVVPIHDRTISRARLAWPRGSELALPDGQTLRLFLHMETPPDRRIELRVAIELYDAKWRHLETSNTTSGFVDLHLEKLTLAGARHAVMVVFGPAVSLEKVPQAFAGVVLAPDEGQTFDPRAVTQRFDLRGRARVRVPLTIDLGERRLRWIDVRIVHTDTLAAVGGYRAALAHIGRDFGDLVGQHSRPTMWDVACIHAAARANTIYIRERDGSVTVYKRRDNEAKPVRLGRLMSGAADDGRIASIPVADAPTWFALMTGLALPKGSQGYALDARGLAPGTQLLAAGDLVAELGPIR